MPTRRQCANALRILAVDAIEKARSGHPGAPLGMADMAEALWRHVLRHNPANPRWPTGTVLCFPTGTPPCCSTACCICPAMTCRWKRLKIFVSGVPRLRGTRNMTWIWAWR